MKFAFYPGCVARGAAPELYKSTMMVVDKLGIELEEIEKSESAESKKIFLEKINKHKIDCLNDFKENFNKHFYDEASKKVKEMKFYISIENEIVRMD